MPSLQRVLSAPATMFRSGSGQWKRLTAGKEKVTTIMYDLHCRQRTFRMIEVVEEEEGVLSVCKNPSDDFPIRPDKHPHLEKLHTRVCVDISEGIRTGVFPIRGTPSTEPI